MSYIDLKSPPKREDRLKACIAHGGTICEMAGAKGKKWCLQNDGERSFTQGSICLLLPALAMLNTLPDNVVLLHSSFHHDQFAEVEYEKLAKSSTEDYVIDIANVQPFEEANLLRRLKPDLFLGHANGNSTAAKLGIPTHVIYNTGLAYIGYKGAYEIARRVVTRPRQRNLSPNCSKMCRYLTPAPAARPTPSYSAALAMFCSLGRTKPSWLLTS